MALQRVCVCARTRVCVCVCVCVRVCAWLCVPFRAVSCISDAQMPPTMLGGVASLSCVLIFSVTLTCLWDACQNRPLKRTVSSRISCACRDCSTVGYEPHRCGEERKHCRLLQDSGVRFG